MATNHLIRSAVVLAAIFAAPPAFSAPKTCVIVVANNSDWNESYWHEMAHCNGWDHPDTAQFKKDKAAGRLAKYSPPPKYRHLYPGQIEFLFVSEKETIRLCGPRTLGCQWFE